jgi:hypothetical protein
MKLTQCVHELQHAIELFLQQPSPGNEILLASVTTGIAAVVQHPLLACTDLATQEEVDSQKLLHAAIEPVLMQQQRLKVNKCAELVVIGARQELEAQSHSLKKDKAQRIEALLAGAVPAEAMEGMKKELTGMQVHLDHNARKIGLVAQKADHLGGLLAQWLKESQQAFPTQYDEIAQLEEGFNQVLTRIAAERETIMLADERRKMVEKETAIAEERYHNYARQLEEVNATIEQHHVLKETIISQKEQELGLDTMPQIHVGDRDKTYQELEEWCSGLQDSSVLKIKQELLALLARYRTQQQEEQVLCQQLKQEKQELIVTEDLLDSKGRDYLALHQHYGLRKKFAEGRVGEIDALLKKNKEQEEVIATAGVYSELEDKNRDIITGRIKQTYREGEALRKEKRTLAEELAELEKRLLKLAEEHKELEHKRDGHHDAIVLLETNLQSHRKAMHEAATMIENYKAHIIETLQARLSTTTQAATAQVDSLIDAATVQRDQLIAPCEQAHQQWLEHASDHKENDSIHCRLLSHFEGRKATAQNKGIVLQEVQEDRGFVPSYSLLPRSQEQAALQMQRAYKRHMVKKYGGSPAGLNEGEHKEEEHKNWRQRYEEMMSGRQVIKENAGGSEHLQRIHDYASHISEKRAKESSEARAPYQK